MQHCGGLNPDQFPSPCKQTESLEDALRQLYVLDAIDVNGAITGTVKCARVQRAGLGGSYVGASAAAAAL